jgi:hypothetical protein
MRCPVETARTSSSRLPSSTAQSFEGLIERHDLTGFLLLAFQASRTFPLPEGGSEIKRCTIERDFATRYGRPIF